MTEAALENIDQAYKRFAAVLSRTEWASREEIKAYQNGLLERLVSFAFANSPFYRDRLAPLFLRSDKPDLSRWADVPILTRDDIERHIERINPAVVPIDLGPVLQARSSGTTRRSFSFRNTYLARMAAACMMSRLYRWRNFDLTQPLASIRTYRSEQNRSPEGRAESRWAYPGPPAPHFTIDVRTPVEDLIDWLAKRRPAYLLTFPSMAHEIALHPHAERVAEIGLKHIVAISEIVSPDVRATVRARLGCDMAQIYGCAEVGCLAAESPLDNACLVSEEAALVEILDHTGKPAAAGSPGKVVVTGFYNYATPFIRYELGDFATLAPEPCASGRGLARLARVEGRYRNALRSAQGRLIWPSAVFTEDLLGCIPRSQVQIRQPNHARIELLIARQSREDEPDYDRLRERFSALLGQSIDVDVVAVDGIPRSDLGKFERVVSMVA